MKMITLVLTAGLVVMGAATVAAQRGGGRGATPEQRPGTPPGVERRVISVPEPATLTLLGVAIGGGMLARGLGSRRKKRSAERR